MGGARCGGGKGSFVHDPVGWEMSGRREITFSVVLVTWDGRRLALCPDSRGDVCEPRPWMG